MSVEGEKELEEFLAGTGALGGQQAQVVEPPTEEETPPAEEIVHDEPPGFVPPFEDTPTPAPPISPEERAAQEQGEETPPEEGEETEQGPPHVVWATEKYGTDTERWAKAMYDQEVFIGRLSEQKTEAERVAGEAIRYAQQVEAGAQNGPGGMPISAAEEAWVEQNMVNPAGAAYTAARHGNAALYNAVIDRIAEENPNYAVQVGTQVQMALQQEAQRLQAEQQAAQQRNGGPSGDLQVDLGQSFQRLGIDVQKAGPAMFAKLQELGEYHPYTLAIMGGDAMQRDLAVQAVYDLAAATGASASRIVDAERDQRLQREAELRRGAAAIVTGGTHVSEPPKQSAFMDAMDEEWRRRGHLPAEE